MKKALFTSSVICFIISSIFIFCLIGYKFTGFLIFVLGAFFLYLALSVGVTNKRLIFLRRVIVAFATVGILFTACMTCIVTNDMDGDKEIACDYVIVLGAGLDGTTPSLTLVDRLERTLDYLNQFPEAIAIVSGGMGDGEDITEAEAMERYLTKHGINSSRIIKEENATNTNENLQFSKKIIDERGGGSVAIVSSDYHIFRARRLANSHGISATMLAAKSSLPILRLNYAVREGFALIKSYALYI